MSATQGLSAADFRPIAMHGFGDPQNSYVHSIALFKNQVYAGTSRHILALLKLFPPPDGASMEPWPIKVPESVEALDLRAQIWRCNLEALDWERVHTSPLIVGRTGREVPRDLGYRGMAVFQGRSDREPALYVSALSSVSRGTGARILRSEDGTTFEAVSEPGLGNPLVSTFRSLVAFDGHLYVAPAGEGTTWNMSKAPMILRCVDPLTRPWELACEPGFGDPTNSGIFELAAFNDYLYAGTFNHTQGYQIWKTPASGGGPCRWTRVIDRGAHRGPLNEMAMSMIGFRGSLYVGSGIQNGGYDRTNIVGPAAGEVIRIHPDDSWDLVVGTPRQTPDGMKLSLSGMGPGFDNCFAGYKWRMVVHDGWLYVSTFDWSIFLPYARRAALPYRRLIHTFGLDQMIRLGGGFGLWRTRDGADWSVVTRNGLGNPYNYGARTFLSTDRGLLLGTANPFGPEVAARTTSGWTYVENPRGGAEVWLGATTPHGARTAPGEPGPIHEIRSGESAESGPDHGAGPPIPAPAGRRHRVYPGGAPRVLLTGATGFIGSHVLTRVLADEPRVRVLALPETVQDVLHPDRVEIVTGDVLDEELLTEALQGIESVYHLAGLLPGAQHDDLMRVNVHGTEVLLRSCRRAGKVRRFTFTSSVAVYGQAFNPQEWPLTEASPLRPSGTESLRDYGRSKVAAESLVRRHAAEAGFACSIIRPSTCYGIGSQAAETMVRRALADPRAGLGPGSNVSMQMIHVTDLAEGIVQAGTQSAAIGETLNLAGLEVVTYGEVTAMIRRLGGRAERMAAWPDQTREWRRYILIYDVSRAADRIGFAPRVTLHDGLEQMIACLDARQAQVPPEAGWAEMPLY